MRTEGKNHMRYLRSQEILRRLKNTRNVHALVTPVIYVAPILADSLLVVHSEDSQIGPIEIWDLKTGSYLRKYGQQKLSPFDVVIVSSDGKLVFSERTWDGLTTLEAWDLGENILLWKAEDDPSALAISPDNTLLFSGKSSNNIIARDLATGKIVQYLAGDDSKSYMRRMEVSADGKYLLAVIQEWGFKLLIWDLQTGACIFKRDLPRETRHLVRMPTSDNIMLSDYDERDLVKWDLMQLEALQLRDPARYCYHYKWSGGFPIAVTSDGSYIVTGTHSVNIWDWHSSEPLARFMHPEYIVSVHLIADTKIIAGDCGGNVIEWDFEVGEGFKPIFYNYTDIPEQKEFSGIEFIRPTSIWAYLKQQGIRITDDAKRSLLEKLNHLVETTLERLIERLPTISRGQRKGELKRKTITNFEVEELGK